MSWFKRASRRLRAPVNRRWAMRRLREYHSQPRDLNETVWWAMHFGGKGLFRIKTLQIPAEISALAKTVAEIRPRIILEIGTASGGTLLIWSRIAAQRVISCDLRDMSIQGELFRQLPPPGSECQITLLSGDSHAAEFRARVEETLNGEEADCLFIDGDHTEKGVRADFVNYRHLVRPGGIIAFHDIVESQPLPTNQVQRLWKTLRHEYDTEEFISDPDQCGFGIGVIHIRERFRRGD